MPPNSPARDPPRRTPHAPARKTKREELSNLLERFYYGDDGTVGVAVDAFSGEPREGEWSSAPCPLHPQTRRRHGLCPLCSALLAKELKRRGSGGSGGADGGGGGNFRRAGSTGSAGAKSLDSDGGARRRRRSKGGGGSFDSFDASDSFEESDVNSINNGRRRASPAPSDFDDLLLAHGGELGALAREALGRSGARCERALFATLFDEPSGGAEPKPTTARRGERGRANSPQAAATSDDAEGPQSPSLEHSTDRLLDPKWARALRQISARLSSRHSSGSLDGLDADEQDYTSYRRAQSRSLNSLNYPEEDAASSPLSRKRRPPDNDEGRAAATPRDPDPPKSLSQLREVVEMAARSAGRFAPADDWDVDPSLRGDSSDDARSATSMDARSASGAGTARGRKNFAERKGTIFPVGPSLRREGGGRGGGRAGRRSAKGAGAGPSDGRKGEGFARSPADSGSDPEPPVGIVRSVQDAASASGSDSSLTFSLCSKDSFGSSASSLAPGRNAAGRGTAPTATPIKEKAHTVSPTSVAEEVSASASSAPSPTRVPSASVRGEPRAIPFGPPFDGCVARSAAAAAAESSSEEEENLVNELVRAALRQVPKRSNHADVAVEDVYSDSDEDERTVYAEPAPTAPLPRSTPQKPQPPKQPASATSPHHGHKAKQTAPHTPRAAVEDVYSDEDERTVYAEPAPTTPLPRSTPQKPQPPKQPASTASPHHGHKAKQTAPHMPPAPAAARPTRRESSFFSALVQNARSRSKSRSRARSRSKSRSRAASRSKSRGRKAADPSTQSLHESTNSSSAAKKAAAEALAMEDEWYEDIYEGLQNDVAPEATEVEEAVQECNKNIDTNVKVHHKQMGTAELLIPSRTEHHAPWSQQMCPKYDFPPPPPGVRGPIVHPHYKLGDIAREEDMIKFPKSKSRKGRRSRRSRRNGSDDDDSDGDKSKLSNVKDTVRDIVAQEIVTQAIGQLSHLDAAFVRRSDGSWTYALVADGTRDEIRFVVSDRGSTKTYPKNLWESSVRRIRVLTQREGDSFLFKEAGAANSCAGGRKKRSIGRGRSRSKGKGRLVSPSPTRNKVGVLNIPSTIMEETRHYQNGRH